MVLTALLLLITFILIVVTLIVIGIGGAAGIIIFGDVIVCILFLVWLIKKLIKRKR